MARHTTSLGNCVGSNTGVGLGVGSGVGIGSKISSGAGVGSGVSSGVAVGAGVGSGVGSNIGVGSGAGVGSGISSDTGVIFDTDNSVGSNGDNGVSFGGGNSVGFDAEVGVGGDPGEELVYLGTQPAGTTTGLASFRVYTVAPTSPIASRGHSTHAFSVSWAMKPPHLLSRAKTVSVSAVVRFFENIEDATVYNEFFEVASDNKE